MKNIIVKISDYNSYKEGKEINGGSYVFKEIVHYSKGAIVAGKHTTSADFDYCPVCGEFHKDCDRIEYIPSSTMENILNSIIEGKPLTINNNLIVNITIDNFD